MYLQDLTPETFLKVVNTQSPNVKLELTTPWDDFQSATGDEAHELYLEILEALGLPSMFEVDEYDVLNNGLHDMEEWKFSTVQDFYNYIDSVVKNYKA